MAGAMYGSISGSMYGRTYGREMPSSLGDAFSGGFVCGTFCAFTLMVIALRPALLGKILATILAIAVIAVTAATLGETVAFRCFYFLFWTLVLQPWRGKINVTILLIVLIVPMAGGALAYLLEGTQRRMLLPFIVGISVGTLVGSAAGCIGWVIQKIWKTRAGNKVRETIA
jgi:hypothetical protein